MRHLFKLVEDRLNLSVRPAQAIERHLDAAAQWLLRAQAATPDDGVAHCYDVRQRRWHASYPETTGYIIPTLYDYAQHYGRPEYAEAARRMALWEREVQLPDGGVRAGCIDAEVVAPTIFNTGQVLFGWARAYRETGDERLRDSLARAADWLADAQDADGAWRRFPSPFTTTRLATYNTRSAFGLVRAFEVLGGERYLAAASVNCAWALHNAAPNGWLPGNSLTAMGDDSALTHTIAYSIRGLLEVGVAAGKPEYIEHAVRMARAVADLQRSDGSLPAFVKPDWTPLTRWSCVTGNAQMALNWQRLMRITDDAAWFEPARRANRFNMAIQDLDSADAAVRGGIKGSHPIDGGYMRYRYPNWAAKFFMDALMLEHLGERIDNVG